MRPGSSRRAATSRLARGTSALRPGQRQQQQQEEEGKGGVAGSRRGTQSGVSAGLKDGWMAAASCERSQSRRTYLATATQHTPEAVLAGPALAGAGGPMPSPERREVGGRPVAAPDMDVRADTAPGASGAAAPPFAAPCSSAAALLLPCTPLPPLLLLRPDNRSSNRPSTSGCRSGLRLQAKVRLAV